MVFGLMIISWKVIPLMYNSTNKRKIIIGDSNDNKSNNFKKAS